MFPDRNTLGISTEQYYSIAFCYTLKGRALTIEMVREYQPDWVPATMRFLDFYMKYVNKGGYTSSVLNKVDLQAFEMSMDELRGLKTEI